MTQETKRAIYEEYNNGDKVKDIAARHGITASAVSHIAKKQGAGQRRPRKGDRGGEAKVCPNCRRKITVMGAKFCCFCGADMRTEKDMLIERIRRGQEILSLLPSEVKDEVQRLFIDIEKELRK